MANNKATDQVKLLPYGFHSCLFSPGRWTACVGWTYREYNPLSQGARIMSAAEGKEYHAWLFVVDCQLTMKPVCGTFFFFFFFEDSDFEETVVCCIPPADLEP